MLRKFVITTLIFTSITCGSFAEQMQERNPLMAMIMYSSYHEDAIMALEDNKDDAKFIASVLKGKTSEDKFRSDKQYRDYIHEISRKIAEILPGILNGTKCNDAFKIEILENFMENNRGIISFLNLFNALRRDTSSQ